MTQSCNLYQTITMVLWSKNGVITDSQSSYRNCFVENVCCPITFWTLMPYFIIPSFISRYARNMFSFKFLSYAFKNHSPEKLQFKLSIGHGINKFGGETTWGFSGIKFWKKPKSPFQKSPHFYKSRKFPVIFFVKNCKVEKPMSQIPYILAAIDDDINSYTYRLP